MADLKGPSLRAQRLRMTWPLAIPFLFLSRPSFHSLLAGAVVSLLGLLLRGWAAGSIDKDRVLAVGGPYRVLRHPLYLGSFFLGFGLALASGRWWLPALFLGLFVWIYRRTIRAEEDELVGRFGRDYESYRGQVPSVIPGLRTRYALPSSPGFRFRLYRRNKEWQATLGALVGYGLLWVKMFLSS